MKLRFIAEIARCLFIAAWHRAASCLAYWIVRSKRDRKARRRIRERQKRRSGNRTVKRESGSGGNPDASGPAN